MKNVQRSISDSVWRPLLSGQLFCPLSSVAIPNGRRPYTNWQVLTPTTKLGWPSLEPRFVLSILCRCQANWCVYVYCPKIVPCLNSGIDMPDNPLPKISIIGCAMSWFRSVPHKCAPRSDFTEIFINQDHTSCPSPRMWLGLDSETLRTSPPSKSWRGFILRLLYSVTPHNTWEAEHNGRAYSILSGTTHVAELLSSSLEIRRRTNHDHG